MSVSWKGQHVLPTVPAEKIPTRVCSVIDDPFYDEDPLDSEEAAGDESETLYEDRFIKLTKHSLTLKCYFFPSGKKKTVVLSAINSIEPKETGLTPWGTVDGITWWNYDFLRSRRPQQDCYFAVDCGEKFSKGFTCKRPWAFWRHFSALRPELTLHLKAPRRYSQASLAGRVASSISDDSFPAGQ